MAIEQWLTLGIVVAAAATGLMAGFFYGFSICVMPALAQRPAPEAAAAMQSINRVVLNAWFLPVFLGTALWSIVLAVAAFIDGFTPTAALIGAGAAMYCLGTFAVTMRFNVPMNNALAAASAQDPAIAAHWRAYSNDWTRWNHVRAVAALIAMLCFVAALV
ncbi:anthrone oxygenase family protein [Lysobacter sp. CA199]|uniref:anthrone oxygenase family protein n=1 Tax=Lysobacter sp. CA199 TaxID=3455608 RepID=UPI003F8D6D03